MRLFGFLFAVESIVQKCKGNLPTFHCVICATFLSRLFEAIGNLEVERYSWSTGPYFVYNISRLSGQAANCTGPERIVEIMVGKHHDMFKFTGRRTYRPVLNIGELRILVPQVAAILSREFRHRSFQDAASFREHVCDLFISTACLPEVSRALVQESVRLGKDVANTHRRLEFHALQMCMDMSLEFRAIL